MTGMKEKRELEKIYPPYRDNDGFAMYGLAMETDENGVAIGNVGEWSEDFEDGRMVYIEKRGIKALIMALLFALERCG